MEEHEATKNWATNLIAQLVMQIGRALTMRPPLMPEAIQTTFTCQGVTTKLALEFTRPVLEAQDEKA